MVVTDDRAMASIIDETTTAGTIYICEAEPATSSSEPKWRISKTVTATGVTTWAGGHAEFRHVADNRASLTYS